MRSGDATTREAAAADGPGAALGAVRGLYERGLCLQAWKAGARLGPPRAWPGAEGRTLAGRLVAQLGARSRAHRLHLRAWRDHPGSESAWYHAVQAIRARLGPHSALTMMRRGGPAGELGAEVHALRAVLSAELRDFDEADRHLARAAALAPDSAWVEVERAWVLKQRDDDAAALQSSARALAIHPWYRPAVEIRARLLVLLGREDEAARLLEEAMDRFESASVAAALLDRQLEAGRHREADATLARLGELLPLADRPTVEWLEGRRSEVAYFLGDRRRASEHGRRSRHPFYERVAEHLDAAGDRGRRVALPVAFVRQHHLTCAPATLAALSLFFGRGADHVEIAGAICYDGTADHAQRRWAEEQGFVAREFTVTWEAARALVDRGLPFALVTVEPGSSHLQAVVGYDEARGTLLLRDPSHPTIVDMNAGSGLESYRAYGPRGMVIAPADRAALLDGIELPEAPLYDLYHRVQAALVEHRREIAAEAAAELSRVAEGHRLALQARRSLAGYDGDERARLAATEALLASFPDDVNLRISKQASLAALGRLGARVEWLRAECARRGHPLLSRALGDALRADARELREAERIARLVVRRMPYCADGYHLLGHILWERGDREEALHAYRTAACLDDTGENYADSYFTASRCLGRTDEALAFLRGRFDRLGRKAPWPAFTLYEALDALERSTEAFAVLERALGWRSEDGALLLFAARAFAAAGDLRRADELLQRAKDAARRADVLRTAARIAEGRGELARAAELWSELTRVDPTHLEAARATVRLLDQTRGRDAALRWLREHARRNAHHLGLRHLLLEWLAAEPEQEIEAELRQLLEVNPSDAWALREMALLSSRRGAPAEADALLERAAQVDPSSASTHNVRASLLAAKGRLDEAKSSLRESLRLDVDGGWALRELLRLSADAAERRLHLEFMHGELVRQVIFGDGLLSYQQQAAGILPADELLETLREGHRVRPDLWHAWVALARQLRLTADLDGARALLEEAGQRFPLLPRVWLELALVHRAAGQRAAQRRALERALAINPSWVDPTLQLAELLHGEGAFEAERALLTRALRRDPSEALFHGWLADALRALGRRDDAEASLRRALHLDPAYLWAWHTLHELCVEAGREEAARAVAEEIASARPRDPAAWALAARARDDAAARMEALDRALSLDPRDLACHEMRMDELARAGRDEEALAVPLLAAWNGAPPRSLRLRAARVTARGGQKAEAVAALEELLASEPDHVEAWEQLADWHSEAGRQEPAVAAAREVVRLAPHRAISFGYLGRALLDAGARGEGKEALRRAAELDPAYLFAQRRLFDLQLEDGEHDAAAMTLVRFERHGPEDEARLHRLRLAVARRDREGAAPELRALAATPERWILDEAATAFERAGWRADFDEALRSCVGMASASRATGRLWLERSSGALERRARRLLEELLVGDGVTEAALGAVTALLERLAEAAKTWRLRAFVCRHAARLAADTPTWGAVGYALLTARRLRQTVAWLADWRGRSGVEAWMLLNLALALRDLGRFGDAAAISREALRLRRDHSAYEHELLLATDAGLAGDLAPIERLPNTGRELAAHYRALQRLAEALRAGLGGPDRRASWREAMRHLSASRREIGRQRCRPSLHRTYRRAAWALARNRAGGGPLTPFWFLVALATAGELGRR
jgi:tetratricopeptide (TPR) repeat protein